MSKRFMRGQGRSREKAREMLGMKTVMLKRGGWDSHILLEKFRSSIIFKANNSGCRHMARALRTRNLRQPINEPQFRLIIYRKTNNVA